MKIIQYVLLIVVALQLEGCLVFIPGQVIGAAADAITGNEGRNCVAANAKEGDPVRMPDGTAGVVAKIEGSSTRCSDPRLPIRALLKPDEHPYRAHTPTADEKSIISDSEGTLGEQLSADEYCAIDRARVGARARLHNGQPATITLVLGASSRCLQPSYPNLVRITPN